MASPLAIDLFCGLGGWTDGLLAEGWRVIGYDIEAHEYGDQRYKGEFVLQDVLTLHGSQLKDADLIVASPPCQEYSYMAMPWSLAKAKAAAIRADTTGAELERLNRLFNACFRIQKEAGIAAGRHIPMVVENVRGAIPWVGRSRYNFGSFHLWGDVPALMPAGRAVKVPSFRFDGSGASFQSASVRRTDLGKGARFTSRDCGMERQDGLKRPGLKLSEEGFNVSMAREVAPLLKGAKYVRTEADKRNHIGINRKAASAMIAKIPEPLSRHIGRTFLPVQEAA
ncbi:MAG: DNA cytosine methyltransferase [Pseudomonadota bacterium]